MGKDCKITILKLTTQCNKNQNSLDIYFFNFTHTQFFLASNLENIPNVGVVGIANNLQMTRLRISTVVKVWFSVITLSLKLFFQDLDN